MNGGAAGGLASGTRVSGYQGVGAPCACDKGHPWKSVNWHPCGCRAEKRVSDLTFHLGNAARVHARRSLASAYHVQEPACPGGCCCCVRRVCFAGGFGSDYDAGERGKGTLYDAVQSNASRGYHAASVWHIVVEWATKGAAGAALPRCNLQYYEAMQPGNEELLKHDPMGYGAAWGYDRWNPFHGTHALASDLADWYDKQRCPEEGAWHYSDFPAYGPKAAILLKGAKLLVFARVESGCPECPTCCMLIMLDYATEATAVLGPVCGAAVCSTEPALDFTAMGSGAKVVDVAATFASFGRRLNAMQVYRGAANAKPWKLVVPVTDLNSTPPGGGDSGRKCVQ